MTYYMHLPVERERTFGTGWRAQYTQATLHVKVFFNTYSALAGGHTHFLFTGFHVPRTQVIRMEVVALKLDPTSCLSAWNIFRV